MMPLPPDAVRLPEDFDFDVFLLAEVLEPDDAFPLADVLAFEAAVDGEVDFEDLLPDPVPVLEAPPDAARDLEPDPLVDLDFAELVDLLGLLFLADDDLPVDEDAFADLEDRALEPDDLEPEDLEAPDFELEDFDERAFAPEDLDEPDRALEDFLVVAILYSSDYAIGFKNTFMVDGAINVPLA